MQQSDDDPQFDEVLITLNRVSTTEYTAICDQLKALPGVKDFRENGEPTWEGISGRRAVPNRPATRAARTRSPSQKGPRSISVSPFA
jgi:hypothetical protein